MLDDRLHDRSAGRTSRSPPFDGEHVSVYVPTTPNPTGGYFIMLPRTATRELEMSVDDALRSVISMGVVAPRGNEAAAAARARIRSAATSTPCEPPSIAHAIRREIDGAGQPGAAKV